MSDPSPPSSTAVPEFSEAATLPDSVPATPVSPADVPVDPEALAAAQLWLTWAIVPAAALLLAILAWTGVLSGKALRRGPDRDVGLGWFDAAVAVGWIGLLHGVNALATRLAETPENAEPEPANAHNLLELPINVLVGQFVMFGPPVLWLLMRVAPHADGFKKIGLSLRQWARDVGIALLALPAVLLLVMAVQLLLHQLVYGGPAEDQIQHELLDVFIELFDGRHWGAMATLLLSSVVFAALFEELVNRGLLQTALVSKLGVGRRWWVVLAVSGFFAALHVGAVPWIALAPLFVLGVAFGWLYERTGSLWPAILVHAGFNAVNVAYVLGVLR